MADMAILRDFLIRVRIFCFIYAVLFVCAY
jgi:hypothetical protein